MQIKAAVVRQQGGPFSIESLSIAEPRADEVLVKIVGVGVCHTDLVCRDQYFPVPLPCVFGHEGSGVVEQVGEGVTKVKPGDHVVLSFSSCHECPNCIAGKPGYCHQLYQHNFLGTRPDGSSALDQGRREGPRAFLHAELVWHLRARARTQHGQGQPRCAALVARSAGLRRPDGCRSGHQLAAAAGRHDDRDLRSRNGRPERGHGRAALRLLADHRRGSRRRSSRAGTGNWVRRTSSIRTRPTPSSRFAGLARAVRTTRSSARACPRSCARPSTV